MAQIPRSCQPDVGRRRHFSGEQSRPAPQYQHLTLESAQDRLCPGRGQEVSLTVSDNQTIKRHPRPLPAPGHTHALSHWKSQRSSPFPRATSLSLPVTSRRPGAGTPWSWAAWPGPASPGLRRGWRTGPEKQAWGPRPSAPLTWADLGSPPPGRTETAGSRPRERRVRHPLSALEESGKTVVRTRPATPGLSAARCPGVRAPRPASPRTPSR